MQMIISDHEAANYVHNLDFQLQIKLMLEYDKIKEWSEEKLSFVERQYKNFLFLCRLYPDEILPPSIEIDKFWHEHILDTRRYHSDCLLIYGKYKHHNPYFGIGEEGNKQLHDAFSQTQSLYHKHFGDYIYKFPE